MQRRRRARIQLWAATAPHNGLELSCPAEAGGLSFIVAHASGPDAPPYGPARRVSFSELLDGALLLSQLLLNPLGYKQLEK